MARGRGFYQADGPAPRFRTFSTLEFEVSLSARGRTRRAEVLGVWDLELATARNGIANASIAACIDRRSFNAINHQAPSPNEILEL